MKKNLFLILAFGLLLLPLASCGSGGSDQGPMTHEMRMEIPNIPIVGTHEVEYTVTYQNMTDGVLKTLSSKVEHARVTDGFGELKPYNSIYFRPVAIPAGTTTIVYSIFHPQNGVCEDKWLYLYGTVDAANPVGFVGTVQIGCYYPER